MRVVLAQDLLEEPLKVLVLGNPSGRGLDRLHLAVDTKFHPLDPDVLVAHAVDELALLVAQEVVDAEDQRRVASASSPKSRLFWTYLPSGMATKSWMLIRLISGTPSLPMVANVVSVSSDAP